MNKAKKPSAEGLRRREFLTRLAGAATVSSLGLAELRSQARQPALGVQLYCVRRELARDMPGTLAAIAKMGFQWVEFADYFGHSAADLRRMLDDANLRCCGTHIYLEDMLGGKLIDTVYFNKTLGNSNLIVRWLGEERRKDLNSFQETIDQFNQLAKRVKFFGMRVGYHNHDYIFQQKFQGKTLWDLLAAGTTRDVILQLDTGNAARAGQDVVELLKKSPGRTASMHVKPFSKSNPKAFLGDDDLDWPTILSLARGSAGTEFYIVEYEEEGTPPLEALQANLNRLRRLLET